VRNLAVPITAAARTLSTIDRQDLNAAEPKSLSAAFSAARLAAQISQLKNTLFHRRARVNENLTMSGSAA
jgi:hypothetical protein